MGGGNGPVAAGGGNGPAGDVGSSGEAGEVGPAGEDEDGGAGEIGSLLVTDCLSHARIGSTEDVGDER